MTNSKKTQDGGFYSPMSNIVNPPVGEPFPGYLTINNGSLKVANLNDSYTHSLLGNMPNLGGLVGVNPYGNMTPYYPSLFGDYPVDPNNVNVGMMVAYPGGKQPFYHNTAFNQFLGQKETGLDVANKLRQSQNLPPITTDSIIRSEPDDNVVLTDNFSATSAQPPVVTKTSKTTQTPPPIAPKTWKTKQTPLSKPDNFPPVPTDLPPMPPVPSDFDDNNDLPPPPPLPLGEKPKLVHKYMLVIIKKTRHGNCIVLKQCNDNCYCPFTSDANIDILKKQILMDSKNLLNMNKFDFEKKVNGKNIYLDVLNNGETIRCFTLCLESLKLGSTFKCFLLEDLLKLSSTNNIIKSKKISYEINKQFIHCLQELQNGGVLQNLINNPNGTNKPNNRIIGMNNMMHPFNTPFHQKVIQGADPALGKNLFGIGKNSNGQMNVLGMKTNGIMGLPGMQPYGQF